MGMSVYLGRTSSATVATVLCVILAACGYQFKGTGLKAPEGVRTIAITVLENRTSETGIERVFTNDLATEFTRSKVLRVVDKDTADAVLSGVIKSMGVKTIAYTANFDSDQRRVTITLGLTLMSRDGKILWSDPALSDREAFEVLQDDKVATDKSRRVAIEAISERLAEKTHNRILQDF
jgi:outer membrane lipopolysaccharide assembly protein LptE/RlpB